MRGEDDIGIPDRASLMRMATAYLARYAASSHRVRQVMERRIRRRCRQSDCPPPDEQALAVALDGTIETLLRLGLLDDAAFTAARKRALQRKGFPERRIRMALQSEGLDPAPEDAADEAPDDMEQARRFAARKRLGPFRFGDRDTYREKDLRSLLRAGFSFGIAIELLDAEQEAP